MRTLNPLDDQLRIVVQGANAMSVILIGVPGE